jgi:uncharacterized integral membrane protein
VTEPQQQQQSRHGRRWAQLWSAIWGGTILIILGYWLLVFIQNKTAEELSLGATWQPFLTQFGPVFIILLGVLVIGHGLIQWYAKE